MAVVTGNETGILAIPAGWYSYTIQVLGAESVALGYGAAPTFAGGVVLAQNAIKTEDSLHNNTPAVYIQCDSSKTSATRCIYR